MKLSTCQSEHLKTFIDRNMENCYTMYSWLCRTIVALMLEMFWKMRQISDYFSKDEHEETPQVYPFLSELTPLTKESKVRRHIRSMSDVQSSTPYNSSLKSSRRFSHNLIYDSDSRMRRMNLRNRYLYESSESSEETIKPTSVESNLVLKRYKSKDSMRFL